MGTGSSGKQAGWKTQLKNYAKQGIMPNAIVGSRENQSLVFREIDRLYSMPQTNATIVDQGNGVWVNFGATVRRSTYPLGTNASEAEKRGVLKWLLHHKSGRS